MPRRNELAPEAANALLDAYATPAGAVTANPRILRQAARARQAYERPQAPVPTVDDLAGFANNVQQLFISPETRARLNMGLAALGLAPTTAPSSAPAAQQPDALYRQGADLEGFQDPRTIPETVEGVRQQGRDQGTNLQFPAYSESVDNIVKDYFRYGLGGFVKHAYPRTVHINKRSVFNDQRKTFGHEATHSQQLEYRTWLGKELEKETIPRRTYSMGVGGPVGGYSRVREMEKVIRARSQQIPVEMDRKYDLGGEFAVSGLSTGMEFMADLQGVEATLPAGQTILDTDLGQHLFRTPEERRYYLVSSLPMTQKLLGRKPELFEVAIQKARAAKRAFNNTAISTSYMKAALKAAESIFGREEPR